MRRLVAKSKDVLFNIGKGKAKGKVAPELFLTEHHAMKAYCGVEL
jgi:hypothetical protein